MFSIPREIPFWAKCRVIRGRETCILLAQHPEAHEFVPRCLETKGFMVCVRQADHSGECDLFLFFRKAFKR